MAPLPFNFVVGYWAARRCERTLPSWVTRHLDAVLCGIWPKIRLSAAQVEEIQNVFFYAVYNAKDETRRGYLERAYSLGRNFDQAGAAAA